MNEVISILVVALLAASGYAAGRMHGQFSYKLGYRFGYRQGYFDGDRATWNRRRRETQAAMAAGAPTNDRAPAGTGTPPNDASRSEFPAYRTVGTTYASAAVFDVKDGGTEVVPEQRSDQRSEEYLEPSYEIVKYDGPALPDEGYRPDASPGMPDHTPSEGLDARRFEAYRRPGLAGRDEGASVGVLTDAEIGHLTRAASDSASVDELGYRSDLGYGPESEIDPAGDDEEYDADDDEASAEYSSDQAEGATEGDWPAARKQRGPGRHSRGRNRELADAT